MPSIVTTRTLPAAVALSAPIAGSTAKASCSMHLGNVERDDVPAPSHKAVPVAGSVEGLTARDPSRALRSGGSPSYDRPSTDGRRAPAAPVGKLQKEYEIVPIEQCRPPVPRSTRIGVPTKSRPADDIERVASRRTVANSSPNGSRDRRFGHFRVQSPRSVLVRPLERPSLTSFAGESPVFPAVSRIEARDRG